MGDGVECGLTHAQSLSELFRKLPIHGAHQEDDGDDDGEQDDGDDDQLVQGCQPAPAPTQWRLQEDRKDLSTVIISQDSLHH